MWYDILNFSLFPRQSYHMTLGLLKELFVVVHVRCLLSSIETTDINQLISTNSPESCQIFLKNLERRGDPCSDSAFLSKLLDCYSKVFARFPLAKHCKTECYARMLVRFAELKG